MIKEGYKGKKKTVYKDRKDDYPKLFGIGGKKKLGNLVTHNFTHLFL